MEDSKTEKVTTMDSSLEQIESLAEAELIQVSVEQLNEVPEFTQNGDNIEHLDEVDPISSQGDLALALTIDEEFGDSEESCSAIVDKLTADESTESKTSENLPNEKNDKQRKDTKTKRKEDRSIEHVLKALRGLKTPEERLAALCKKYTDLLEELRGAQMGLKQSERRNSLLGKEKEQLQTDYSKAILARSRLEGLCRELQRQCKVVKDESILRVREEEEKRKEVSAKFQTTLTEISNLMQENTQKNSVLREENMELSTKLKTLVEQYDLREKHVEKILKHKDLELQLSEAKLAKLNMEMAEEKERYLREKQKLLGDLTEYQRRCTDLSSNEVQLRAQLAMYTDKYSEFQDTLTKSNQVFTSFKGEMEKMSKKIKKLEKETGSWKSRWENSNRALLEMAEDKQKRDLELLTAQKKIVQLEKLCRALHAQRLNGQEQLKVDNKSDEEVVCNNEVAESEVTSSSEPNVELSPNVKANLPPEIITATDDQEIEGNDVTETSVLTEDILGSFET